MSFLLPALAKAIYGSFYRAESEISNVVNYRIRISFKRLKAKKQELSE